MSFSVRMLSGPARDVEVVKDASGIGEVPFTHFVTDLTIDSIPVRLVTRQRPVIRADDQVRVAGYPEHDHVRAYGYRNETREAEGGLSDLGGLVLAVLMLLGGSILAYAVLGSTLVQAFPVLEWLIFPMVIILGWALIIDIRGSARRSLAHHALLGAGGVSPPICRGSRGAMGGQSGGMLASLDRLFMALEDLIGVGVRLAELALLAVFGGLIAYLFGSPEIRTLIEQIAERVS